MDTVNVVQYRCGQRENMLFCVPVNLVFFSHFGGLKQCPKLSRSKLLSEECLEFKILDNVHDRLNPLVLPKPVCLLARYS